MTRDRRPNFYYVGGSKCGSSTLHDILVEHPDIFLPRVKETEFFRLHFKNGLSWYLNQFFADVQSETAIGEIQPSFDFDLAPQRLFSELGPELKILMILRDPIDRAYSQYLAQRQLQGFTYSFSKALTLHDNLVEGGLYYKKIKQYERYFGATNIKIYTYEKDFLNDRENMILDIQKFLGVMPMPLPVRVHSNPSFEYKSQVLSRVLHARPQWLSKALKVMVPFPEARRMLSRRLEMGNRKPRPYSQLDKFLKKSEYSRYFIDDARSLKRYLGGHIIEWDWID